MRRLITTVVLSSTAFFSVFAGGNQEAEITSEEQALWANELQDWSGETLRMIMIADPWIPAFDQLNPKFEAITGAEVQMDAYGYDQTHEKQVLEGTQKSSTYDVIVLDSPWVGEFWEGGFVEDLTPYIEKTNPDIIQYDDFVSVFRDVAEWDGHIVGMPFSPYFITYYYRKDIFEQEGLSPPRTYAEWLNIADRFTDNPNYPDMFGLTMNNQQGSPVGQAWFEYIWNFGGRPFKSTYPGSPDPYADMTPMFDSPESIAVVELFKEALKYQPEGALSFAWDERTQLFASGRAAQVSSFNLRAPLYIDPDRSRIAGDIATAVVPAAEGFDPVPPVGGWVIGINKHSVNKDMAWDYIKWFTSPSTHREFVDLSGVAARYSAFEDPELADKYWWFPVVAESADMGYAECRPRIPESFEIISTVGLYVSRALTGELSSQEAMSRANEEIRQLLEERGYPMSE